MALEEANLVLRSMDEIDLLVAAVDEVDLDVWTVDDVDLALVAAVVISSTATTTRLVDLGTRRKVDLVVMTTRSTFCRPICGRL